MTIRADDEGAPGELDEPREQDEHGQQAQQSTRMTGPPVAARGPRAAAWIGLSRVASLGIVSALSALFFIDLCDLIFDCNCRSLWAGAADHCNVHDPSTRDCPWCTSGAWGVYVPMGVIVAGQALALLWPGRLALRWRIALAVGAFFLLGGAGGVAFGLAKGYWA
jgi:hypothetical protein